MRPARSKGAGHATSAIEGRRIGHPEGFGLVCAPNPSPPFAPPFPAICPCPFPTSALALSQLLPRRPAHCLLASDDALAVLCAATYRRAYNLQDQGLDTVDANVQLGHGADERTYDEAALILHDLGVTGGVRLLTNNLDKIEQLRAHGIAVAERIQMTPTIVSADAAQYLHTKVARMNHQLQLPPLHGGARQPERGGTPT